MGTRIESERLKAWEVFLTAHAAVLRSLERELVEELGLPLAWYEVLLFLNQAPGGQLRMQELADRVLVTQSGVSRLVDRMEGAGLVERASCPTDRRGTFAMVTEAGVARLREASPIHLRGVDEHFLRYLDEKEIRTLRSALGKVVAAHSVAAERAASAQ